MIAIQNLLSSKKLQLRHNFFFDKNKKEQNIYPLLHNFYNIIK